MDSNNTESNVSLSIIIATYNRKKYLGNAIDSVLNQTYKNLEIIIIDDASTDKTDEYVNTKYRLPNIRYFKNPRNKGCGFSRKYAMQFVKGKYIVFLDDDDKYIDNDYFKKAVKMLEENKELSLVCAPHIVNDVLNNTKTEKKFPYKEKVDNKKFFLNFASSEYPKPIISVAVIRKEALIEAKFQEMKILNDTTIFLRAILYGPIGFISKPQAEYLIHGNNLSFNCKTNFIIDNLDEKYKIFKMVQTKNIFSKEQLDKWIENQLDITIIYFIKGSKPNYLNFRKIISWYRKNINNETKIKEFKEIYKENRKKQKYI